MVMPSLSAKAREGIAFQGIAAHQFHLLIKEFDA
jgi:hypothetical protein